MRLRAETLRFSHGAREVLCGVDLELRPCEITAIIGANGSGKSTLLSLLAGLVAPASGHVQLDAQPLAGISRKALARSLAILPQNPQAPEDIRVRDLVAHGRFAHRKPLTPLSDADHRAIDQAMEQTGTEVFAERPFHALSGGERQRVWIALALAQAPRWLLLDEPTSFLDMGHQYQVLSVLRRLNRTTGIGLAMVLHDLNHAAQFADRIIVLSSGRVIADGAPSAVVTSELIAELYGLDSDVLTSTSGVPVCVPKVRAL